MTPPCRIFPWNTLFLSLVLLMLFAAWPGSAQAGCQINIYVLNKGTDSLKVSKGKVKIRGGLWKSFGKWWEVAVPGGLIFNPGDKKGGAYSATFNCGAKRRYQISYQCTSGKSLGGIFTDYYPSTKTWTTNQTVNIPLRQCR